MAAEFQVSRQELRDILFRGGARKPRLASAISRFEIQDGVFTATSVGGSHGLAVECPESYDSGSVKLNVAMVAQSLPSQDPLRVQLTAGKLILGTWSIALNPVNQPAPEPNSDAQRAEAASRFVAAARLLRRFDVSADDLLDIALPIGPSKFSPVDQRLTEQVARAWALLAPYNVTPDKIKTLIDEKLRTSWKKNPSI